MYIQKKADDIQKNLTVREFLRSKNSLNTSSRKGAVRRPWKRGEGIPRQKEIKIVYAKQV